MSNALFLDSIYFTYYPIIISCIWIKILLQLYINVSIINLIQTLQHTLSKCLSGVSKLHKLIVNKQTHRFQNCQLYSTAKQLYSKFVISLKTNINNIDNIILFNHHALSVIISANLSYTFTLFSSKRKRNGLSTKLSYYFFPYSTRNYIQLKPHKFPY